MASYNVENLDGLDPQARYDRVASQIVGNLRAPDILSLEEIQDNDGAASAAPTSADVTYRRLIAAIVRRRRPALRVPPGRPAPRDQRRRRAQRQHPRRVPVPHRQSRPELRRPRRRATADDADRAGGRPGGTAQLTLSPGRVDPTNPVFNNSRKPLAAEFRYRGKPLFIVGNHFASKGGDDPVYGRFQEPRRPSELQRRGSATSGDPVRGQAGVVNTFVRQASSTSTHARACSCSATSTTSSSPRR